MSRLALRFAVLPLILLVACSGDKDSPRPSEAATAVPEASAEPPSLATTIQAVAQYPVTFAPVDVTAVPPAPGRAETEFPQAIVYDHQTGALFAAGEASNGWLPDGTLLVRRAGRPSLYDPATLQWRDVVVPVDDLYWGNLSPDGKRVAYFEVGDDSNLRILELETRRLLVLPFQNVLRAYWSPDSTRLLLSLIDAPADDDESQSEGGEHGEVLTFGSDIQHVRLSGRFGAQTTAWHWLDASHVIAWEPSRLHTFELNGAQARQLPDRALPGPRGALAFSPKGDRVAVQTGADVTVYSLPSFDFVTTIPYAGITGSPNAWSSDGRRIAFFGYPCQPGYQAISVYDFDRDNRYDPVRAGAYQVGFVPNSDFVYYTDNRLLTFVDTGPRSLGDGRGPVIFDDVNDLAPLRWSPNGRYAAFARFTGGYDRC
jgi:hypothetical protein